MQILCPTDLSPRAMEAGDIAVALAAKMNLPLRLLHCGQTWVSDMPLDPIESMAREQLAKEAARLRGHGVEVIEEFRRGNASIEIIAAAGELPTKLVIIGSVGNGKADRWLIGSVAEHVAEGAPVPTLVVREPAALQEWLEGKDSLKLFCAVDESISSEVALGATQTFLTLGEVELESATIRVAEYPTPSTEQQLQRQRDVWQRMRAVLGDVPVKVHICYSVDHPAIEFLHVAETQSAQLVVVGTHQRHGLKRLLAPSFSRCVIGHAKCNVLCVPAVSGHPGCHIPAIRRVLVAINFTSMCAETLRHAHSLLPQGGAIHFVHVCHEPKSGLNPVLASSEFFATSLASAAEQRAAKEKIKLLPASLMEVPGVTITSEILAHHDVATAILDAAQRADVDVICLGSKGRSRLGVALLGSTVQSILSQAHKPVFVVTQPVE